MKTLSMDFSSHQPYILMVGEEMLITASCTVFPFVISIYKLFSDQ
jgi:hypothetical protein